MVASWPTDRLVAIWNSLPGVTPAKTFATSKIWECIQRLGEPAKGKTEPKAKGGAQATKDAPAKEKAAKKTAAAKKPAKAAKSARPAKKSAKPAKAAKATSARDGSKKAGAGDDAPEGWRDAGRVHESHRVASPAVRYG